MTEDVCKIIKEHGKVKVYHITIDYEGDKKRGHIGGERKGDIDTHRFMGGSYWGLTPDAVIELTEGVWKKRDLGSRVLYEAEIPVDRLLIDQEAYERGAMDLPTPVQERIYAQGPNKRCTDEVLFKIAHSGGSYGNIDTTYVPLSQAACLCEQMGGEHFKNLTWLRLPASEKVFLSDMLHTPIEND